jgi:hypothetical protein
MIVGADDAAQSRVLEDPAAVVIGDEHAEEHVLEQRLQEAL